MIIQSVSIDIVSIVITSIISIAGIMVPAIIGIFQFKKESYNKRVTEERIRWLNKVREDYSTIMAAYDLKHAGINNYCSPQVDKNYYDQMMFEATQAKYNLISRLNTNKLEGNEYNYYLKDILSKMEFIATEKYVFSDEEILLFKEYMNLMLEQEWQKSKKETK